MARTISEQVSSLKSALMEYPHMQETDPAQWLSCLQIARSIMIAVDRKSSLRNQPDAGLSVEVIEVLQTAAYQDPDGGGEVDIALWCERQWATEMQRSPDSYTALQGKPEV